MAVSRASHCLRLDSGLGGAESGQTTGKPEFSASVGDPESWGSQNHPLTVALARRSGVQVSGIQLGPLLGVSRAKPWCWPGCTPPAAVQAPPNPWHLSQQPEHTKIPPARMPRIGLNTLLGWPLEAEKNWRLAYVRLQMSELLWLSDVVGINTLRSWCAWNNLYEVLRTLPLTVLPGRIQRLFPLWSKKDEELL